MIGKASNDPICKYLTNYIIKKTGPKQPTLKEAASKNPRIMTAAQALAIEAAALIKKTTK